MKKILLLSLLVGAAVAPLHAVKTTVTNKRDAPLHVLGYGLGCAGVVFDRGLMCGVKPVILAPNQSKQILYRTNQLGTKGGIRALSLYNGVMYNLDSPKGEFKKLPDKINFPGNFKQISPDLRAEKARLVKKLSGIINQPKAQKKRSAFVLVFDKRNKAIIANERNEYGAFMVPIDGKMILKANAKGEPEFAIYDKDGKPVKNEFNKDKVTPGFAKAKAGNLIKVAPKAVKPAAAKVAPKAVTPVGA